MPYDYDPVQGGWRGNGGPMPPTPAGGFQPQPLDPRAQKDAELQNYIAQTGSGTPNGMPPAPTQPRSPLRPDQQRLVDRLTSGQLNWRAMTDPYQAETMRKQEDEAREILASMPSSMSVYNGPVGTVSKFGPTAGSNMRLQSVQEIGPDGFPVGQPTPIGPDATSAGVAMLPFAQKAQAGAKPGEGAGMAGLRNLLAKEQYYGRDGHDIISELAQLEGKNRELDIQAEDKRLARSLAWQKLSPGGRLDDFTRTYIGANPGATPAQVADYQRQFIDALEQQRKRFPQYFDAPPGLAPQSEGVPSVAAAPASAPVSTPASTVQASQDIYDKLGADVASWIKDTKGVPVEDLLTRIYRHDRANKGYMQQRGQDVIDAIGNMRGGDAIHNFMAPGFNFFPWSADSQDTAEARAAFRHFLGSGRRTSLGSLLKPSAFRETMPPIPGSPGAAFQR